MTNIQNFISRAALLLLSAAAALYGDAPPTPDANGSCGGNCQVTCVNGCDSSASYSWQQARCCSNSLSDTIGPYCADGYNCDFGACGRANERACNLAGTGCTSCATGYQYSGGKAYCIPAYASPGNHANWMRDMAAHISNKKLNEIMIPGTHDTGTSPMIGYGKTQNHTIAQQLTGGVRYFDLRPGFFKTDYLVLHHGIDYGGEVLQTALDSIKSFLASSPGEIVILKFSDFGFKEGTYMGMTAWHVSHFEKLVPMIDNTLGPYLVNHAAVSPTSTIGTIWGGSPTKGHAIIIFDTTGISTAPALSPATLLSKYWNSSNVYKGFWANSTKRTTMKTRLETFIKENNSSTILRDAGAVLTPYADDNTDDKHKIWFPSWLAEEGNPVIQRWLKEEWSGNRINIVTADFYEQTCLVPMARWYNSGKPAGAITGCYSWPTANKTSWDEKVWNY